MLALKSASRICGSVLVLAVVVTCQYMGSEDLQSLDLALTKAATADRLDFLTHENYTANATILHNTAQDEKTDKASTSQEEATSKATEPETGDAEGKSSIIGMKGADRSKLSVVPKKGVHHIPSVVPKKGADPESSTPSVSARKGADPESSTPSVSARKGADPESSVPSVSARKGADPESSTPSVSARKGVEPELQSQSVSARKGVELPQPKLVSLDSSATSETTSFPSDEVIGKENATGITESGMTSRGKQYSVPIPQLLSKNNKDMKNYNSPPAYNIKNTGHSEITATMPTVTSAESSNKSVNITNIKDANKTSNVVHSKPAAAVDKLGATPGSESESVNYTAVIFGIILVVAFITLVVVGYHKFQDVWMRRHYAHVDFLVDGMYDE